MKIKKVYLWEKPIRPNHTQRNIERSYDFSWKSLADFQANGWNNIVTNGSYTIDSDGVKQTSWSNDRSTCVSVQLPAERENSKKIEVWFLGSFQYASWWWVASLNITSSWDLSPATYFTFNSLFSDNSWYRNLSLYLNSTGIYDVQQGKSSWLTTFKMIIDFENKTVQTILTWANTRDRTDSLTDAQLTTIKSIEYLAPQRTRGYSSYNGNYIKSLWYKIYF